MVHFETDVCLMVENSRERMIREDSVIMIATSEYPPSAEGSRPPERRLSGREGERCTASRIFFTLPNILHLWLPLLDGIGKPQPPWLPVTPRQFMLYDQRNVAKTHGQRLYVGIPG